MKDIDIIMARERKDEVIPIGKGMYLALSSNKKSYYVVDCHINKGDKLPKCTCRANRFGHLQCSHLKKVAQYVEVTL